VLHFEWYAGGPNCVLGHANTRTTQLRALTHSEVTSGTEALRMKLPGFFTSCLETRGCGSVVFLEDRRFQISSTAFSPRPSQTSIHGNNLLARDIHGDHRPTNPSLECARARDQRST
jgi:hypothetical protein